MTFSIAFYVDSVPFTPAVLNGTASLGGSESACLGLARALAARGHRVSIYARQLEPACVGPDAWGVRWFHSAELDQPDGFQNWDVFCSLRMPAVFNWPRSAGLRILWNQDLMNQEVFKQKIMACAWAYDKVAYVSRYHQLQWEERIPELKGFGYETRNGYDPAYVPTDVVKDPLRIIHISRPERGLKPLLQMWPAFRKLVPGATLQICRYSSMYDASGWGEVCADFDRQVEAINAFAGGITYLGELGKADLYKAIADAAVMWYPGIADFAETSCIAAVEAQACGTPFVGSLKGALPETVPSGILIAGDAATAQYQRESMDAVVSVLDDCAMQRFRYRKLQQAGRAHVEQYTYAAIAAEWEAWIETTFRERYEANKIGVLRQLLHYDDHTAAKRVAEEIKSADFMDRGGAASIECFAEAKQATLLCDRVIAGLEQTAENYAERAADPIIEAERSDRFKLLMPKFEGCTHLLDLACGPGSFALAAAKAYPDLKITAIDYAEANIRAAQRAAEIWGVADRCTFICAPVFDFETQQAVPLPLPEGVIYDGLFIGEFLEHCGNIRGLVDGAEQAVAPGAAVVFTVPYGPMVEIHPRDMPFRRGHVHHFHERDLREIFQEKSELDLAFLSWSGVSSRGYGCGTWVIAYRASGAPTHDRPYAERILTTRPHRRLSIGIIAKQAEFEIGRCLDSVWGLADEIVIGLCGSTDATRVIARAYDAAFEHTKIRFIDLPPVEAQPDGFSAARNAVMAACTGDWFLWIDTDETLINGYTLGKYLEGHVFIGYVLHQYHLQMDAPNHFDRPVRLFRTRPDIQFYGCVHEQPQLVDCNGDIEPALEVDDAKLAHVGYLTCAVRREKMLSRNLPLVARDQERFPDRRLGKVIYLRDCANLGDETFRLDGDRLSLQAKAHYLKAIELFEAYFADPADKHHEIARPFYERSIRALERGVEVEWSLAGKPGGLNGAHAKPHRFWVQTGEELKQLVDHHVGKALKQMEAEPVHVDPYDVPQPAAEVPA